MTSPWSPARRYTLPGVLDQQAGERPDQLAMHIGDEPITYRRMRERSVAVANGLLALGVEPGDTVALFGATSPEWVYAWFATQRIGARAAAINVYNRGDFLLTPLRDSNVKVVLTDPELADRVGAVAGELPDLETVVLRASSPDAGPDLPVAVRTTEELLAHDTGRVTGGRPCAWNEPGTLFFTSGTTGPSKAVLCTSQYLCSAAWAAAVECWGLEAGETVWSPLPLFHLSAVGTVLGPMLAGGSSVLETAFHPAQTWDRVREFGCVGVVAAGAIVNMLWNLPEDPRDADLPIRFVSAAPIAEELYEPVKRRYGCEIVTMYGLTEAFPLTIKRVGDEDVPGASGTANPNFEFRIFDDEDHEVPVGGVGEIVCRPLSPHVMSDGYLGHPESTVERTANLWFHTGDLGRVDEQGRLYYVDRKKDAIRRRGENVSSYELEQAILRHPAVAEAAAIGVPSDVGEDEVMVCVTVASDAALDMTELMDFCVERMPYFAVPRYVDVVDELPKNAMGRVTKDVLRGRGITDSTWDREAAGYVVQR